MCQTSCSGPALGVARKSHNHRALPSHLDLGQGQMRWYTFTTERHAITNLQSSPLPGRDARWGKRRAGPCPPQSSGLRPSGCTSPPVRVCFPTCTRKYYSTAPSLDGWIWRCGTTDTEELHVGGLTVKLHVDFPRQGGLAPKRPPHTMFKGQLCISLFLYC